jgi:alpha-L-rhamnosidase
MHNDPDVRPVGLCTRDASEQVSTAFRRPSLRWRLAASRPDVAQVAYELEVAANAQFDDCLASTGRIESAVPFGAIWPRTDIASREVVWCRVRVWTDLGLTDWSEPLRLEGALYQPADWIARPISPLANAGQIDPVPAPLLRRAFTITKPVSSARLYVTALGIHDISLNGVPASDALFDPGWTAYQERLLYACHDITSLLQQGENVLASAIGDGWWRGNLTWLMKRAVYGDTTALLAQLEITYADGTCETIATDETWRGSTGSLIQADLYNGCEIDLAREPAGWRKPGFDARDWEEVKTLPLPKGLEQRSMAPVREVQSFDVGFHANSRGTLSVDCGQNITGYLRLHVTAQDASSIQVRHAEVLETDGSLHTAALREAKATDIYHVPPGEFILIPIFTYHGFRYAEIELGSGVELQRIEACVVATDLPETGHFQCSDARLIQLDSNIRWSQRGNFFALPTDCPQRDERLGWTGDIQVFGPTACVNFDSRAFLANWLADLAIEQAADGQVPSTVPNVIQGHAFEYGGIGWADAATLVPWAVYEAYGDTDVLAAQFASMRGWVDYGLSRVDAEGVWTGDFHLGDWLDPGAPPDKPEDATTDRDFIASAYLARSAAVLARAARILGDEALAEYYAARSQQIAMATWHYWQAALTKTQAGCAIALVFGIVPAEQQQRVGECLAMLATKSEGRIATGFLGTPAVLPALTMTGQMDAAFRVLMNEQAPGWLYQVINGATTMWERWDAILPDGSINRGEMAADDAASMISFNHYAYGCVGAWLYRSLAGIAPCEDAPGYTQIVFAPQPGGGIDWVEASVATPFGLAEIRWDISRDGLTARLVVPAGATGCFHSPHGWSLLDHGAAKLGSGTHVLTLCRDNQA